jgi:hypothetical protein
MLLVTVTVGWLVLLAVEFLDDHWTERSIITTAVFIVMAVAVLVYWWRWEQEIK